MFIDAPRSAAVPLATIGMTWLTTGPLGIAFGRATGKRSRLPKACPARSVELLFQPLILPAKAIAFALQSFPLLAQSLKVTTKPLDLAIPIVGDPFGPGGEQCVRSLTHTTVMPESVEKYNSNLLDRRRTLNPLNKYLLLPVERNRASRGSFTTPSRVIAHQGVHGSGIDRCPPVRVGGPERIPCHWIRSSGSPERALPADR